MSLHIKKYYFKTTIFPHGPLGVINFSSKDFYSQKAVGPMLRILSFFVRSDIRRRRRLGPQRSAFATRSIIHKPRTRTHRLARTKVRRPRGFSSIYTFNQSRVLRNIACAHTLRETDARTKVETPATVVNIHGGWVTFGGQDDACAFRFDGVTHMERVHEHHNRLALTRGGGLRTFP